MKDFDERIEELEDEWDELEDKLDDEDEKVGKKILRVILHRPMGFAAVIGVVTIAVLAVMLTTANADRKEMREEIDRLEELYTLLQKRNNEIEDTLEKTVPVITVTTVKAELEDLSELVTQEYIYTNSDKLEQDADWIFGWTRPLSTKSIILRYDGTIKAGIDLSEAEVAVDEDTHIIDVILPPSEITDHNIPPEDIDVLQLKNGFFNKITDQDTSELITQAKMNMEQKAIDRGLLDKANREARSVIKDLLSSFSEGAGYTVNVTTDE